MTKPHDTYSLDEWLVELFFFICYESHRAKNCSTVREVHCKGVGWPWFVSFLLLVRADKQLQIWLLEDILISCDEPQRVSSLIQMRVRNHGVCGFSPGGGWQSLHCVKRPLLLWHAAGWCNVGVTTLLGPHVAFHVNGSHRGRKTSLFPVREQCWFGLDALKLALDRSHNRMWELPDVVWYLLSPFCPPPPSRFYGFVWNTMGGSRVDRLLAQCPLTRASFANVSVLRGRDTQLFNIH